MYHQYFGLKEAPFSIAVNPRYLFMSARHREALAHLLYGVGDGGGFILLTGEVGTGKTTINRCLLDQLPDHIDLALVLNPAVTAAELLATVCDELGISYDSGEKSLKLLTDKIHHFLLENHANKRKTVLLIDEAQHLKFDVLEQIRLLTNLETNTEKLLQIILVGQPELQQLLAKPELRQLSQRITARYQLKALNQQETDAYIRHRLQIAGFPSGQELFPPKLARGVYRASKGIPRLINVLCDRMLLGAYAQNKNRIDEGLFKQAVIEVFGEESEASTPIAPVWLPALVGGVMIVLLALGWWQWSTTSSSSAPATASTPALTMPEEVAVKALVPVPKQSPVIPASQPLSPAPELKAIESPWYNDQEEALNALLLELGLTEVAISEPCSGVNTLYRCESREAETWIDLLAYNRPAVLKLVSPSKMLSFAVLLGVDGQQAILVYDQRITRMSLEQLGQLWSGQFVFIWQPPPAYTQQFALGDRSPVVQWMAARFAELDGQQKLLSGEKFNAALAERVKIFQRQNDLADDGVVGLMTLLKLNEQLDNEPTLVNYTERQQSAPDEG